MTNVLLCHGSDDIVVPVKDICSLQSHLSHARTALRIITNADHNYRQHTKEICHTIAHYFSSKGRKEEWTRRTLPNWKAWVHAVGGVLNFRTVGDIWIPSTTDGTMNYLRPGIIYRCAEYVDISLRAPCIGTPVAYGHIAKASTVFVLGHYLAFPNLHLRASKSSRLSTSKMSLTCAQIQRLNVVAPCKSQSHSHFSTVFFANN